jgi:pimeloyl-ACP methyl ester carboxylesterase
MRLERFDFPGSTQWALVCGQRPFSPVLLLVQAGPGIPMIHEARAHEHALGLEKHFRVVYWDQRGAGKSFDRSARGAVTVADLVADVGAMIRALSERFGVAKIDVVGFSLGASLALLAAAADPAHFRSLTCVGPDVNFIESERFAYSFAIEEARRHRHKRALRALRFIGEPPHDDTKRFMTRIRWVANFRGINRGKDFAALVRANLSRLWASPHYSLREKIGALRGMRVTQERVLPSLRGFDLLSQELRIRVPMAFFQGRHDVAAPPGLTAALAQRLGARLTWFDESAHVPHEEEPRRFREELLRFIRPEERAPPSLPTTPARPLLSED